MTAAPKRRGRGPKELPQSVFVKAPVKLTNVTCEADFNSWMGWAQTVWKEQKLMRTQRLGPRDLGYHKEIAMPPALKLPLEHKKRGPKPKNKVDMKQIMAPKVPPKDDRKLKNWQSGNPPSPTVGVCGLPEKLVRPVLAVWGFLKAFQHGLHLDTSLKRETFTLEAFVAALTEETVDLPLSNTVFSALASIALSSGYVVVSEANILQVRPYPLIRQACTCMQLHFVAIY